MGRLFLAVEPDASARRSLVQCADRLRRSLGQAATHLRWVGASEHHLTLHFLGDVDGEREARLCERLAEPTDVRAFAVRIGSAGTFPERGSVRVLWLAIAEGREPLARLHHELAGRTRAVGLKAEDRPFTPHLTLARARGIRGGDARRLREQLASIQADVSWRVDRVVLLASDLSGARPRYAVRGEMRLLPGGAEAHESTAYNDRDG